jgi:hypothetical protein
MSRLLFAAARGARISWMNGSLQPVPYYIHPDDAHLQYGPISTELRKMAEDSSWNSSWGRYIARAFADEFSDIFGPATNYPLFYLILAECLADEGM